jgi:hypothetical protein
MCVLIVCTTFVWNISHLRKIQRDIAINVCRIHVLLFLSDFTETWMYLTDFQTLLKYQVSWQSVQWKPHSSMQMDRQTWQSYWLLFAIFSNMPKDHSEYKDLDEVIVLEVWKYVHIITTVAHLLLCGKFFFFKWTIYFIFNKRNGCNNIMSVQSGVKATWYAHFNSL